MNDRYGRNTELSLLNDSSWRPLGVSELRREMERLFDDFWTGQGAPIESGESRFVPPVDIEESPGHYLLSLEMPGIPKDDIKIEVHDNQIVVTGERSQDRKSQEGAAWYSERRFGKFQRSFKLPPGTRTDGIEADYRDGILSLMVPKAETAKPRQIKIGGASSGILGKLLGSQKNDLRKEEMEVSYERRAEKAAS